MWLGIGSSYLYDRGILFASLDEFIKCEFGIFITIHVAENFVHPLFVGDRMIGVRCFWEEGAQRETHLFRGVLIQWKFDHRSSHPIDRLDDLKHLIVCDGTVSVNIVQLECP